MMYRDMEAISYLISQVDAEDPGSSSHWRKFHKDFALKDDGSFSGIQGFGGCSVPYRGIRYLVHGALQWKFRRIGRRFPCFDEVDNVASSIARKQDRAYDFDLLRQAITLSFLKRCLPWLNDESVVAVIGDGFAAMTSLLLASGLAKHVLCVNLNKTLLVDTVY